MKFLQTPIKKFMEKNFNKISDTIRFEFLKLNFISLEFRTKEICFLIKLGSKQETIFFPKYGILYRLLNTGNKILAGITECSVLVMYATNFLFITN